MTAEGLAPGARLPSASSSEAPSHGPGLSVLQWERLSRTRLGEVIGEALVIVPLGATEQHGPHLATGTDLLLATTVAQRAAERAAPDVRRPLLLAPPLPYGASDHHLPFGATLSLREETLRAVLDDLLRSLAGAGARRVLLLNGHGGNRAACAWAASEAGPAHGLDILAASYWELADAHGAQYDAPPVAAPHVPGHAGWFETSLVLALDGTLTESDRPHRPAGTPAAAAGDWAAIDGYTDDPSLASAADGERLLTALAAAVAEAVIDTAR